MKALSVRQPWALEIDDGVKKLEFRTWRTSYRGPLLICASSYDPGIWVDVDGLDENGQPVTLTMPVPTGCMMCVVDLVNIREATPQDAEEYGFDHDPGLLAWEIEWRYSVEPDAIKGKLNLFEVPDELIKPLTEDDAWWNFEYPNFNKKRPKDLQPILPSGGD